MLQLLNWFEKTTNSHEVGASNVVWRNELYNDDESGAFVLRELDYEGYETPVEKTTYFETFAEAKETLDVVSGKH